MPTIAENLKRLGCNTAQERQAWLDRNKEEIKAYWEEHGTKETIQHFKTSYRALERLGVISKRKVKEKVNKEVKETKNQIVTPETALDMLPREMSIGDIVNAAFKRLIERIKTLEKEIAALKEDLKECNETLSRAKEREVTLGEVYQAAEEVK